VGSYLRDTEWTPSAVSVPQPSVQLTHLNRSSCSAIELRRFQSTLEAGQNHWPAAKELIICAVTELVAGNHQAARVADRLHLPRNPLCAFCLYIVTRQCRGWLHQPAVRIDVDVFPFNEGSGGTEVGHSVVRDRDPRRPDGFCRTGTCAPGSRPALIRAAAPSLF
jgi:hypothetical protein